MADVAVEAPVRNKRNFLDEAFVADKWEAIQPYYQNLGEREIGSVAALQKWLQDWSELETAIAEYARWTYVRTTIDTRDEKAKENLMYVYAHIYPNLTACEEGLKRKFVQNPWLEQLDHEVFFTSIRRTKKDLEIFRQENIALQKEMNIKQSRFDQITGAQSITHNGEELTVQQAVACMKNTDRKLREEVFVKLAQRRLQDADTLDELLSELIQLRNQAALNAGYKNYIDFRFDELGRFDYGPADCIRFHNAVEKIAIPVMSKFTAERKKKLGIETLKPWDLEVDISGKEPLKPFANAGELIEKTINCFNLLDPYFGERISIMNKMHYLDLESRMNKGTGGYNISMPESGVPFVFMNSVNSEQDVVTMVHEGGHAIQTFLTHALSLYSFKEVTSEIAEVASMAMELLSMEHWNIFY
jgi:oligoendopeptidase F